MVRETEYPGNGAKCSEMAYGGHWGFRVGYTAICDPRIKPQKGRMDVQGHKHI